MCMLPPFAAFIRRWIVLSKIKLFIEVPSCADNWGTISGWKLLCSWRLLTFLVVLCTGNQTTAKNKIKNLCWPVVSLQVDPSCCGLVTVDGVGCCCNSSHRNAAWSAMVPRKISLHSPIFSSEVWLVASLLLTAVFPLIAITLPLLLIYPEICSLSTCQCFPSQEKNSISFCPGGAHDLFLKKYEI